MSQRSPVIIWLLLVATLCVDAIAIAWLFNDFSQPKTALLFMALAYAQTSVLCTWAILRPSKTRLRWIAPFAAGFLAAIIITFADERQRYHQSFAWEQLLAFASVMWVHVAGLLLLLWLLKPTRLFMHYSGGSDERSWRFSIKHLLILSTILPVLVIVFKNSAIVRSGVTSRGVWEFVLWVAGNIVLSVASAAITPKQWMWLLKLAACAGAGLASGLFLHWAVPDLSREGFSLTAFSLIQAFVSWVWLEALYPSHVIRLAASDELPSPEEER
jgi:hypothetical protein